LDSFLILVYEWVLRDFFTQYGNLVYQIIAESIFKWFRHPAGIKVVTEFFSVRSTARRSAVDLFQAWSYRAQSPGKDSKYSNALDVTQGHVQQQRSGEGTTGTRCARQVSASSM